MDISLNPVAGGPKDTDVNPVERVGPASNPLSMVSLVGNHIHRFNTFVCLEIGGYERPGGRGLASSHAHSSPWTSPGNYRDCGPWVTQLFDDC